MQLAELDTKGRRPQASDSPGFPTPEVSVSLIVCTYNRRLLLQRLIESILPQLDTDFAVELLIVDNNSRDDTAQYVKSLAASDPRVRYVRETRQGLSHARNGGAVAAAYPFLMYLDDDAVLPPDYLATLGRLLKEHDPDFLGGPVYPLYADPKPDWFPESLEIRKKASESGFHNEITLSGGNYGIRKSILQAIGGFNPDYGMTGGKTGMLEERLVVEAYRRRTPPDRQKIYYSLDNYILHHTPRSRMRLKFQLKRIFIADYQYVDYCLQYGVRSPGLLFGVYRRRLLETLRQTMAAAPQLWRQRRSAPEKPVLALVKLTYRVANFAAAARFLLTDFGEVGRRRRHDHERRPLRIAFLTTETVPPGAAEPSTQAPDMEPLLAELYGCNEIELIGLQKKTNDQIRAAVRDLNMRSLDLILTDSAKAAAAVQVHRADIPRMQIVLWIRDPAAFDYLSGLDALRKKAPDLEARFARDKTAVSSADQLVLGPGVRLNRLARFALGARSIRQLGQDPAAEWREVLDAVRVWAPFRLK